jgi:hypothetical protein
MDAGFFTRGKAYHSPPSSDENEWVEPHPCSAVCLHGMDKDNFTLTLAVKMEAMCSIETSGLFTSTVKAQKSYLSFFLKYPPNS